MKLDAPLKTSQTSEFSEDVDASDPQEIQKLLTMIDKVLRMRFPDYSPGVAALEPLNLVSDTQTLDDVFTKACYEKTFDDFCRAVERICGKYDELTGEPRLLLANVFNNHVATVLGKPGEITAQFLRMSVRRISPELAEQLDFESAKSEPTVFVFGNNVSRICDLIFTVPYKDGRTEVFPIIVLMEHKSAPDRNVVKQMLTSLVATLEFSERYPERFKTSDGKIVWPFVVLFYTGAQQWEEVRNLPDLFTTSLKELDQDWIFNLRFLFVSLVHKKIEVVPTIPGREAPSETFDEALMNADWLVFFFDLLRKAELLTNNPTATREEWLNDAGDSLRILKDVYDSTGEYDAAILDDALSLISIMCAKKRFVLPTRDELLNIMEHKEVRGMIRRTWLLSDKEREAAENDGELRGERKGKLEVLTQVVGLRFPKATPESIQKVLNPLVDAFCVKELTSVVMSTNSIEEFQKRVNTLTPAGC